MTPLELLGLIAVFFIARVAMSFRSQPVAVTSPPTVGGASVPPSAKPATPSARTVIIEYLDAFIVAGLVALFLITFVVRTFFIPSGSMEPTLQVHDVLLVNEFEYRFAKPHDGDIVVFKPPIPSSNDFIKRLVGGPGDQLRVHNGVVYRNGVALDEHYEADKPDYELEIRDYGIYVDGARLDSQLANVPPRSAWSAPDRIPNGYYFMMGDNRNNSEDSHVWGFAELNGSKSHFTGHAFLLFWPFDRIRILK